MLIRKRCGNSEEACRCSGFEVAKGDESAASREEPGSLHITRHLSPSSLELFHPAFRVFQSFPSTRLPVTRIPPHCHSPLPPSASCATGCLPHCIMNTWGNLRVLSRSLCSPSPSLSPTSINHARNHGKCPTNTATPAPSCEGWSDPDQAKRHQP